MDEKRWTEWGQCFTEDATLDTTEDGAPVTHGRDAIQKLVSGAVDAAVTVHHGHMPEIEITGPDSARGIWSMEDYLEFPSGSPDAPAFTVHGRGHYREEYAKGADGAWRIRSLRLTRLWLRHGGSAPRSVRDATTEA